MNYPNQKFVILDENDRVKIVTLKEWAMWFGAHSKERIVARDEINGYTVSTIFLGLDHQFLPNGRPLYWETMIFDPPTEREHPSATLRDAYRDRYATGSNYQDRYSTAAEARAGHVRAVEWLKAKLRG